MSPLGHICFTKDPGLQCTLNTGHDGTAGPTDVTTGRTDVTCTR